MATFLPTRFLRYALLADAIASGVTSLLLLAGAAALQPHLNLPTTLLQGAGMVLVPFVGFLVFLIMRERISHAQIWFVIAGNAAWAIASVLLPIFGTVQPSTLGAIFVVAQGLAVGGFAVLQYVGLRQTEKTMSFAGYPRQQ